MDEAGCHEANTFLTLTYDEEHLPIDGSLVPHHFQDFIKRLRERCKPQRIRYFHCGEYGDEYQRPHYHAALFGYQPTDEVHWSHSNGEPLYRSEFLEEVWSHGMVVSGTLTFESAAYIARYVTKKVNGVDRDSGHYVRSCPITGRTTEVLPEYATMSRRPGIGRDHYERYSTDIYPHDEVILRGHPCRPPRYYTDLYREADPSGFEEVRRKRTALRQRYRHDNTDERLAARERVKLAQFNQLKRGYDHAN